MVDAFKLDCRDAVKIDKTHRAALTKARRVADACQSSLQQSSLDVQLARTVGRAEATLSLPGQIPDARNALAAELKALVEAAQEHLHPR